MSNLSKREQQLVFMAADGLIDKQIAREMGVTLATIRSYWSRLRKKTTGVNKVQAVVLALDCLEGKEIHKRRTRLGIRG